jgi:hypothetical protein
MKYSKLMMLVVILATSSHAYSSQVQQEERSDDFSLHSYNDERNDVNEKYTPIILHSYNDKRDYNELNIDIQDDQKDSYLNQVQQVSAVPLTNTAIMMWSGLVLMFGSLFIEKQLKKRCF